ncbi:MAG TPA: hypothetical protein DDY43_00615 [Synechococcales bacterium UBA10510]|nr:hypothetical protein [Synechococcales bacterium UBA10510]
MAAGSWLAAASCGNSQLGNSPQQQLRLAATALNRSWPLAATAINRSGQNRPTVKHCRTGIAADDSAKLPYHSHSRNHSRSYSNSRHRRKFDAKWFSPSSSDRHHSELMPENDSGEERIRSSCSSCRYAGNRSS